MAEILSNGSSTSITSATVQAQLALLTQHLSDALMLMDADFRILWANPGALRISNLTTADFNGRTLWEIYPGVYESPLGIAYREAVATREQRQVRGFYYEGLKTTFDLDIFPMENGVGVHYRDVTAICNAEFARDRMAAQLGQVLATTTDGIISIDPDFRITYMNDRARDMLAPSGEVLGTNLWEAFPLALYPGSPFVEHYNRAMQQRVPSGFQAFYPEPLNLWFEIDARPAEAGIILFFRDITEQKQRDDALRASEERYRVLTELNPQSLWTADPAGRVLYANQRFLTYIGHDFVPKTGEEYIACFDPDDRARVVDVWTHSVITGEDYNIEARLLRAADSASRWWHLRALPIRDESGSILQWLGVANDIHERRLASEELRMQYAEIDRQRREVEAIYRGSPIGMALYEPRELRVLRMNDRQAEILGVPPELAVGRTIYELTPGVTAAHALMQRAARGEPQLNHSIEGALTTRNGEYNYWNVNYSPIFNEHGEVQAVAGATIEITHQKRAEAALIQTEKLAAVGRLASSIAHEINNPLESVMNLIYIARQHAILPEVQHFLDLADQELRRVAIIANQTLRFHKQSSKPQAIACNELFSTVLTIYEGRLKNSNITVETRKRASLAVLCFEGEIRQVINNLVSNAIDAMPRGGRLIIRSREATDWASARGTPDIARGATDLTRGTPPGRGHVLTVADTGSGIPPETQARMFEAFFTTKGFGGTGLGLWISKEIMDRHHGRIRLRSSQRDPHRGTVFTLFLPFDSNPTPDPGPILPT